MKRYAIVRVDKLKFCPSDIEGIDDKLVCSKTKDGESKVCICRYGDTKKQLLNKIETAIKRKLKGGYSVTYRKFGKGYIKDSVSARELAESIIEFLGVEE